MSIRLPAESVKHPSSMGSPIVAEVFTGLVQHMGRVVGMTDSEAGSRLSIDAAGWDHTPSRGDSINVSGVCLTVANDPEPGGTIEFDVVTETLKRSVLGALQTGSTVNLEHAARADTLLGGHIVQGHVDAVGRVTQVRRDPEDWRVRVSAAPEVIDLAAPKGSVTLDGVSLTVASVGDDWLEVALIPETLERTTLGDFSEGRGVNIETDIIARQVAHYLARQAARTAL